MKQFTTGLALAVFIIASALILALAPADRAAADEYRAFWIDSFHAGALDQADVDQLLGVVGDPNSKGDIRNANCNAVFVQVRRNADVAYPSGMGEPYMSGLTPSDFNALQAVINAAHDTTGGKQRVEVHAWLVEFRTKGGQVYLAHSDTPTGSLTDLDNYWPTLTDAGAENADQALDPGHPLAEEYLVNVCMDLVNNFDIDGIHYDYIRFTANNEGYNPTSVARYNARYSLSGQPSATNTQWQQWRRDQVTAFVRKTYAKIQTVRPSLKQSVAVVTWAPSPSASTRAAFQATRPYYQVYSDWDAWLQEGIVDMVVPMAYFDWGGSYADDYTGWMDFMKDRKANRHAIVGPGLYLNSLANSIAEILQTRDASPAGNYAQGFCGYSYFAPYTNGGTSYGTWSSFYPQLVAQVTPTTADIPSMPWKTSPTKGHLSGTVYDGTKWVDGAYVSITGPESRSMYADGTGFYAFIDLAPGTYSVTVNHTLGTLTASGLVVSAGNMTVKDFNYSSSTGISGTVKDPMGNGVPGATVATTTGGYSTVTGTDGAYSLSGVAPGTYSVTASRSSYTSQTRTGVVVTDGSSTAANFQITPSTPVISAVAASDTTTTSATITWTTNVPASSRVEYGPTRALGTYTTVDPTLVTAHSVTLTGLTQNHIYHFRVMSSNSLGQSAESAVYTFFTAAPASGGGTVIVDNTDVGFSASTGTWSTGTTAAGHYGDDYRYASTATSNTAICYWTPTIPAAGTYNVYVYYPEGSNRSTKAPFTIYYNGGSKLVKVNQQSNGGMWYQIAASLSFAAGTSGYVRLANGTSESSKVVMADAVKFESTATSDTTAPTVPTGLSATAASTTEMNLTWTASTDTSGIGGYRIYRNGVLIDATEGETSYSDFGLSPNTTYTYTVAAYDVYGNASAQSGSAAKATLCLPISVTCNRPTAAWQTASSAFTFTNTAGFGTGTVNHIRYTWDRTATHTWTDTETSWSSSTLTTTASPGGNDWYLHARAYNADNVPNGQVDLGPFYCDTTAPRTPTVTAARYTVQTGELSASWTGGDDESGISAYEYAIGSTSGGTNIKGWTANGTDTSVTASVSPALTVGGTYYFSVRSTNGAGTLGGAGVSTGTTVAKPCASIAEAKGTVNGFAVQLDGRYVTYAAAAGAYIEDPNRISALYLPGVTGLAYGNVVTLAGILGTSGLDRTLTNTEFQVTGQTTSISPIAMALPALGGGSLNQWTPGIAGGIGPNTIGLLVRTWGKVTSSTPTEFCISDGTKTVKVISTTNPGAAGQCYVLVTGICGWEEAGGVTSPVIIATEAPRVSAL